MNHIKRMHIKGLKKFKDIDIEFNEKINILVGENESGKSTILEAINIVLDLSQYLGHILVETAKTFSLFLNLQTPVELSNESNYGFDYDYKILQCS
ncbi:DUF2813 domain-containing protein [Listeria monocytogenes]|nr:DUF2813 domain-containing protein [Listeria monocytogenes]